MFGRFWTWSDAKTIEVSTKFSLPLDPLGPSKADTALPSQDNLSLNALVCWKLVSHGLSILREGEYLFDFRLTRWCQADFVASLAPLTGTRWRPAGKRLASLQVQRDGDLLRRVHLLLGELLGRGILDC